MNNIYVYLQDKNILKANQRVQEARQNKNVRNSPGEKTSLRTAPIVRVDAANA